MMFWNFRRWLFCGTILLMSVVGQNGGMMPQQMMQQPVQMHGQMPMMQHGQMPMMQHGQMPMMAPGQMPMMPPGQMPMMGGGGGMPMMGMPMMPGGMQLPAPAPAAEAEAPRNRNLLSATNTQQSDVSQEFMTENRNVDRCIVYNRQPGSCDPELTFHPCVACKSEASFKEQAVCPGPESFRPGLKGKYVWQYVMETKKKKFMRRTKSLCVVRQISNDEYAAYLAAQEVQQPMMEEDRDRGGNSTMLIVCVGAGVMLLLIFGGVGMACMMIR